MANVLHLCNDFTGSRVYVNLYKRINQLGYSQTVFAPARTPVSQDIHKQDVGNLPYNVIYSSPLKYYHRLLFEIKRNKLRKELVNKVDIQSINLIHATTLFSDGAIAYDIYKKYNIPYIVTVRSTDISIFLKYRPDLIRLAFKILKYAHRIIFVSAALRKRFFNHKAVAKRLDSFIEKCEIIPNGINEFWLNNIWERRGNSLKKILFVGKLVPRKNALALVHAVLELKSSYKDLELTVVGGGGSDQKEIEKLANSNSDTIRYQGVIKDTGKLRDIFREHDVFAMPSYNETFGLVYIEALSQGLPILYARDDGVDGLIPSSAGCNVDAHNEKSITQGIEKMIKQFPTFDVSAFDFTIFDWVNIAKKYQDIYEEVLN